MMNNQCMRPLEMTFVWRHDVKFEWLDVRTLSQMYWPHENRICYKSCF